MDSNNESMSRTYTPSEVAKALGVSENTIRRSIRKGWLCATKIPGNKKTYAITMGALMVYAFNSKGDMFTRASKFRKEEEARAKEAMSLADEEIPVWMRRKKVEDSNATNATQQPMENASSPIENMEQEKSDNLIEFNNNSDNDLYILMKRTKLKINLINSLIKSSIDEREKYKELKEDSEGEWRSIRHKIHQLDLEIIEHQKKLAVETFNLENCRLEDADHKIEKRIDAEMATSSADGMTDTP